MGIVEEAEAERPPPEVIAACMAIGLTFLIACSIDLFPWTKDGQPAFVGALVLTVVGLVVVRALLKRTQWLRSLLVGITAVSLLCTVIVVVWKGYGAFQPFVYVQGTIQAIAAVLLVLPRSNEWFRDD